jgi:hypothetical protein
MASSSGSITTFQYLDDAGDERVCRLDKSNATALGFGVPSTSTGPRAVMTGKPRPGLVMRQVSCFRILPNGETLRRKFPIPTLAAWSTLKGQGSPTITVGPNTFFITAFIGEQEFVSALIDTALTDAAAPTP